MTARVVLALALALLAGCADDDAGGQQGSVPGGGADPALDGSDDVLFGADGGALSDGGDVTGSAGDGDGDGDRVGPDCGLAGCGQTLVPDSGRVDLLFVVDDSGSMQEEQEALAREFPRLMRKLTSGDHDEDGEAEYTPVEDLHLGVVSTDLGAGVQGIPNCDDPGDSGRLLDRIHADDTRQCSADLPVFLTYEAAAGDDSARVADDFACRALLGVEGCGFEMPLESALKALWPSADPSLRFVSRDPAESFGQSDRHNAGFLRNDPAGGAATLAIIVVTDEDDCSAHDHGIFTPDTYLAEDHPLHGVDLNLRCFTAPEGLYDLERYLHGYRGVHGFTGARVLFAAIVGVPVDLVDQVALENVDWNDEAQREAHYQTILDDPRMQQAVDESAVVNTGSASLVPSCESENGKAYPPRRIVSLARMFGPNSLVQSICGDNLGPPIDIIVRNVLDRPD